MIFHINNTFPDWITLSQDFPQGCPIINNGYHVDYNIDGSINYESHKRLPVAGSHSTTMTIRATGYRQEFSGNPNRWNRADNVFGDHMEAQKDLLNEFVTSQGMLPFTSGKSLKLNDGTTLHTGAQISRVDMACIAATGSKQLLVDFLYQKSRMAIPFYEVSRKFNTIYWGEHSDTKTIKIYDKSAEVMKHLKDTIEPEYMARLIKWLETIGAFRIETKFHERYLNHHKLKPWAQCTQQNLFNHFKQDLILMTKPVEKLNIDDLTGAELGTLMIYLAGIDPRARLAKNTFYKHKKTLMNYGYDISNPAVLERINTKPKLISLQALIPPDWYRHSKQWKQLNLIGEKK